MTFIPDKSKFKNSVGVRYTKGLFYEMTLEDKSSVIYTLKDREHMGYPSLYQLYLDEEDLTEYDFANKYLDSYEHWHMLTECSWFKEHLERWRRDLYLKIQARALKTIKTMSRSATKEAFQANTYLLERKWEPKTKENTRGRPSKEEIKQEAARMAEEDKIADEAAERIGLRLN